MMPQQLVAVGRADALAAAAARHHLTLRHSSNVYQTMLLFSLAPPPGASEDERRWYAMQATCPHLEAPLEHATLETVESELEAEAQRDITDVEDTVVVCPHHEWSWSLRTGESDHSPAGMRACTFAVSVQDGMLSVEAPQLEQNAPGSWLLVESRPVSERFYEPKPAADAGPSSSQVQLVAPDPVPQSLTAWASLVLNTANPRLKVHYTRLAAAAWRDARCTRVGGGRWNFDDSEAPEWRRKPEETPPGIPPRDQLNVVRPGHEAKRGKGGTERGRIALLHSLASIEQIAIDLAWDIICRGPELFARLHPASNPPPKLPNAFYTDFLRMAEDEAKHHTILCERLEAFGVAFGDLPVHYGLFDSMRDTWHSLTARLSIVHLVHEARGLDVNPGTIARFAKAGDEDSVATLQIIHHDEVTHVATGHRWLCHVAECMTPPRAPVELFREEVRAHFCGALREPFNRPERAQAGLTAEWYEDLRGEKRPGDGYSAGGVQAARQAQIAGG